MLIALFLKVRKEKLIQRNFYSNKSTQKKYFKILKYFVWEKFKNIQQTTVGIYHPIQGFFSFLHSMLQSEPEPIMQWVSAEPLSKLRSEERRVGKECRYRWRQDDEKKEAGEKEGITQ